MSKTEIIVVHSFENKSEASKCDSCGLIKASYNIGFMSLKDLKNDELEKYDLDWIHIYEWKDDPYQHTLDFCSKKCCCLYWMNYFWENFQKKV